MKCLAYSFTKEDSDMEISHRVLVPGLILAWLISSPEKANEPAPTVDSVLAKWEEASQKVKTLDAKLTVWRYDQVFDRDHQATITLGRFYYEAPNLGRYEIRKNAKGATNDWSSVSEAIIWTGKETLWIEGDTRRCRKFSTAELQLLLSQPEYKKSYWFSGLFRGLLGAEEMLPLTIGIHATEVRERFEVTLKEKRGDERIELKVVPKPQMVNARFREIDVILDAKTYMTIATQEVSGNGTLRTVLELSEQKVNQRPSDRNQLLFPDLSGLRVDKIEPPPSRLEKRVGIATESRTSTRPLDSHLMVDERGVIWDGGKPVGVWDVNGGNNGN